MTYIFAKSELVSLLASMVSITCVQDYKPIVMNIYEKALVISLVLMDELDSLRMKIQSTCNTIMCT